MADRYWQGTTGDFTLAANWGGTAPIDGDRMILDDNAQSITSNHTATGLDNTKFAVGQNYTGSIGATGSVLELTGATTLNTVEFDGLRCPSAFISATVTANVFNVKSTSQAANALVISGTWGSVNVIGGRVTLASGAVVTTLRVLGPNAIITINTGATVTTITQRAGKVTTAIAPTTWNLYGGEAFVDTTTAVTITTVNVDAPGALFKFHSKGGIVSTLNANAGTFTTKDDNTVKTISAGTVLAGATVDLDNDNLTTATLTNYGGLILGGSNVTVTTVLSQQGSGK